MTAKIAYECTRCGARNCKLWREYQTFTSGTLPLWCLSCVELEATARGQGRRGGTGPLDPSDVRAGMPIASPRPQLPYQDGKIGPRHIDALHRTPLLRWPLRNDALDVIRDALLEWVNGDAKKFEDALQILIFELWRGHGDQVGWFVPAVLATDGETFWGYTSVPDEAVAWWHALPSAPAREPLPKEGTAVSRARERHMKQPKLGIDHHQYQRRTPDAELAGVGRDDDLDD